MRPGSYAKALDRVLKPVGFVQEGRDWLRESGGFLDCVNLQVSSYAGITANIYTKDLATDAILREALAPALPTLMFVISARIGELIDGNDRWWRKDPNGPVELADAVSTYALPFLDSLRPLEAQALQFGRAAGKWSTGPLQIHLAITLHRMGEHEEACAALANPPKRLLPSWLAQVEAVRNRLGCGG